MADFATLAEAEARAQAKMLDGTWVVAYGCLNADGAPAVRFMRHMDASTAAQTADGMNKAGGWDQTVDAAAT